VGKIEETFVEGYNQATGQWIGRTSQNRTLNFVHPQFASPGEGANLAGSSWNVRVTRAGPNSLAGEVVV
jgi:tRNA-2-methylthio-N6-dimethylallyladenosine synthase